MKNPRLDKTMQDVCRLDTLHVEDLMEARLVLPAIKSLLLIVYIDIPGEEFEMICECLYDCFFNHRVIIQTFPCRQIGDSSSTTFMVSRIVKENSPTK